MTDQTEEEITGQEEPAPKRAPGRLLAAFATLLALSALAAVGYLYFLLVYLEPNAHVARSLAQADGERAALRDELRRLEARRGQSQAAWTAEVDERLAAADSALTDRLNQITQAGPPSERAWKLAEVEYLLRVANHRLLMEQDRATALSLLQAADGILEALNDMVLHPVRAALADEMLALSRFEGADVQGLYLQLDALKRTLESLALARPQYRLPEPDEAQDETDGVLDALAAEFRQLLQFRRIDTAVKPLLAPDEAIYLELNLRLMLEQAQLAALKRDHVVFDASLGSAQEWMRSYLALDDPAVQNTLEVLDELRQLRLDVPLPDLSASLNALMQMRRAGE